MESWSRPEGSRVGYAEDVATAGSGGGKLPSIDSAVSSRFSCIALDLLSGQLLECLIRFVSPVSTCFLHFTQPELAATITFFGTVAGFLDLAAGFFLHTGADFFFPPPAFTLVLPLCEDAPCLYDC